MGKNKVIHMAGARYNTGMTFFSSLKTSVLDLLFPLHCADCGAEGSSLCALCRTKLRFIPPSCFVCKKLVPTHNNLPPGRTCKECHKKTSVYCFLSPFSYGEPIIKLLVHDLKYRRVRPNAAALAELLHGYIQYFRITLPPNTLLVPIPLHKTRERLRGFNQSFLIAQNLGKKLGVEVHRNALRKIKKTVPQMELSREERLKNAIDTFAVSDMPLIRNRTILLLDDVKTTGATLEEASRVLRAAGAKKIWAITVAH